MSILKWVLIFLYAENYKIILFLDVMRCLGGGGVLSGYRVIRKGEKVKRREKRKE